MKPVDLSLATFDELKPLLSRMRQEAHCGWLAHGPGTTREVAALAKMDLLTFRPRSTELYQLGLLELVDEATYRVPGTDGNTAALVTVVASSHEGIYRARTIEEWEAYCARQRENAVKGQLQLAKI